MSKVRDKTLLDAIAVLDRHAEDDIDAAVVRARLFDDILRSMSPAQKLLMRRWRSYICKSCGETMEAQLPDCP